VEGGLAQVKVGRHEECGSCGACGGAQQVVVEAVNEIGAQPGQRVLFEFREANVLTGAFVVFILPLLFGGVGAVIGHFTAPLLEANGSLPAVIGALLFFLLALGLVRKFDRRAAQDKAAKPVIIEILDNQQS
jgi:sigma-E factor negative regulatory protein RseC